MDNALKIVSFVLLGTILCAVLSGACWYYFVYNYYTLPSSPILGSSKDFEASMGAIIGVLCGCIGGVILSLVVAIIGIPKVPSFFVGAFFNGIIPIMFFLWMAEGDLRGISEAPKYFWLSLLGQFVIGGVIGFLVSALTNLQPNHPK